MLPYTATDLIEIIRRETRISTSSPPVHTTQAPTFFQQLHRWVVAGLTALR